MNASTYPTALCALMPISGAPASTIPWIELAADISGVCRVAGTLPMTSMPTSSARTKIVRSVTSAVDIGLSLGLCGLGLCGLGLCGRQLRGEQLRDGRVNHLAAVRHD